MRPDYQIVEQCKLYLEESRAKTKASRDLGILTRKYYDGEQLNERLMEKIQSRGQPAVWENIILKIGNRVAGIKDSTKTEIGAFRRRVPDKAAANVFTNVIRSTRDTGEWAAHKSSADFDLMIAGLSVMKKKVSALDEFDVFGNQYYDILDEHISFERVWIDPYARKPDYADGRYLTIEGTYSRSDLLTMFDREKVGLLAFDSSASRVVEGLYLERALIYHTWYKEEKAIRWAIWGGDVLLSSGICPYAMDRFPFSIRRANKIDPKNPGTYYGMFKSILPLQDRINYAHLRIANMIGSKKLLFESDAVDDPDEFADDYALDDSVTAVRPGSLSGGKFREISLDSKIQQLMAVIEDTRRQAEEIVGLNAELLGTAMQRLSGYAIENRQNSGLIGLQQFMNASMELDKDSAEMTILLAQQYIKAEQVYQIMDKREADAYFIVNETIKNADGSIQYEGGEPKRRNTISSGHYTVILHQIPASRGSIAERQKSWAEMLKSMPEEIRYDMLSPMLRDTDSPVADEVKEIIDRHKEATSQQNGNQEAMMAEFEKKMALMDAKIADFVGKAKENEAQAALHLAKAGEIQGGNHELAREH